MFLETTISARRNAHLQVEEFMCRRCGAEATNAPDAVCELCKAIGKSADPVPDPGIWSDIRFGVPASSVLFLASMLSGRETDTATYGSRSRARKEKI
jgi:hypothetical protein